MSKTSAVGNPVVSTSPPTTTTTTTITKSTTVSRSGFPLKTTTIKTTTTTTVTTTTSTGSTVSAAGIAGLPRFAVEEEAPIDHRFLHKSVAGAGGVIPDKISQQWHLLDANLPSSILARAYRRQPSLLRACFVGGTGTPYQSLLFFFDFYLPPDFPASPPRAYFRYRIADINRRLPSGGRVVLKILNTWIGNEWKPYSTIFGVMVAIQKLFNDNAPLFSNPLLSCWRCKSFSQEESDKYNEKVYVNSCSMTLDLLQESPTDFKGMVKAHFHKHADEILADLNNYMLAELGTTVVLSGGLELKVTKKFKGVAQDLYKSLCNVMDK